MSGSDIYLASSTNGYTFSLLSSSPLSYTTRSRPALGVFNSKLYVAYTTTNGNVVSGPLFNSSGGYQPSLTYYGFQLGNSNHNGVYAGLALAGYNGELYLVGQATASSQGLYSTTSSTGTSFPSPVSCGPQLRYTPSIAVGNNGFVQIVYQGDHNTRVYTQFN